MGNTLRGKGGGGFMNILLWIIFGALAGWIAAWIMGREQGFGMDVILGIVGAIVGGFIMRSIGADDVSGFNIYSLLVAIVGAIILIAVGRMFRSA